MIKIVKNVQLAHEVYFIDNVLSTDVTVVPKAYIKFPDTGMAYKYYAQNFTWDSARKHCIADGGNLAVIDSLEKMEQVVSKMPEDSPPPFVGIHRLFDHSEWVNLKTGKIDGTNLSEKIKCFLFSVSLRFTSDFRTVERRRRPQQRG